MYALIEFTGPNPLIAVVHKNWIFENKCYWPPFAKNTFKLNTAVRNGQPPDPKSWSTYEMHVIGGKYFDTYEAARRRLNFSQEKLDASDLSSAEEVTRLRKRAIQTEDDSDSDLERSTVIQETPKPAKKGRPRCSRVLHLPPPPAVPLSSTVMGSQAKTSLGPSLVAVSSLTMDISSPSTSQVTSPIQSSEAFAVPSSFEQRVQGGSQHAVSTSEIVFPQSQLPSNFEKRTNVNTVGVNALQESAFDQEDSMRSLHRQMNVLTAKIDFALDILRTMMHARPVPGCAENSSKLTAFCFPLSKMDDFNNLEVQLKDTATRNALLDLLVSRGGDNVNQITYRIVAWLLADDIQNQFSIAGKKNKSGHQKRCFRITRLFTVICDGVKKQPKGSVASDKDIEKAVEYWLKRASKRLMNERSETTTGSPEATSD